MKDKYNSYKIQVIMKNAVIDWYLEEMGIEKTIDDINIVWYSGYDTHHQAILKTKDNLLFECIYRENDMQFRVYESLYNVNISSQRFNTNVEF